ncbi:MAG: DNA mismatch repair endonuclease MutL [Legionellaceae bacterium]|nr:DNA mismatch repair endonuclease MutL [Legionellaceae bacterium]
MKTQEPVPLARSYDDRSKSLAKEGGTTTETRIHQLPAFIANQIAAGEVIERPASVVKELLENALDAGSDVISIEIGCGGLNQIKISDNGSGIVADDLPLAIAAHATSKIQNLDDLYGITSMGFRGEALASIASVSRLTLSSRPSSQTHAMMLQINETGVIISPCARNQGTTVDVHDLFINAPVRKKFLKTERAEFQAIEAVVKRFALSVPAIALTLKHNGKQTLALPAVTCEPSRVLRIKKLLGKDFIDEAIYFDVEQAGIHLQGWVSHPMYQRSQRDKQWIYLNRRMIKDKLLHHAILQAYQHILHPGRFPACLLYLSMPVSDVDVNVHPTKHEVRFQDPRTVHDFVISSITHALQRGQISDYVQKLSPEIFAVSERSNSVVMLQDNESHIKQQSNEALDFVPSLSHNLSLDGPGPINVLNKSCSEFESLESEDKQTRNLRALWGDDIHQRWTILNSQFSIIFLNDNKPYLVNLALAQQQYYEHMMTKQLGSLLSRPLLVPVSYVIDKVNYSLYEQYQPRLAGLGIQFDFMSETRIMVRTIPQCLPLLDIGELFKQLNGVRLEQSELIQRIAICQSFDVHHMSRDEKADIMSFLQQKKSPSRYCLHLDITTCLNIWTLDKKT